MLPRERLCARRGIPKLDGWGHPSPRQASCMVRGKRHSVWTNWSKLRGLLWPPIGPNYGASCGLQLVQTTWPPPVASNWSKLRGLLWPPIGPNYVATSCGLQLVQTTWPPVASNWSKLHGLLWPPIGPNYVASCGLQLVQTALGGHTAWTYRRPRNWEQVWRAE